MAKGLIAEASPTEMLWRRMVPGSLRTRADYRRLKRYTWQKHGRFHRHVRDHGELPPRGVDMTDANPNPSLEG